jgi:hypothetical protein
MKIKSFCWFSNLIFGNSLAFFIEKLGCYSARVGGDDPRYGKVLAFTSAHHFTNQEKVLLRKRYEEKKKAEEESRTGSTSGSRGLLRLRLGRLPPSLPGPQAARLLTGWAASGWGRSWPVRLPASLGRVRLRPPQAVARSARASGWRTRPASAGSHQATIASSCTYQLHHACMHGRPAPAAHVQVLASFNPSRRPSQLQPAPRHRTSIEMLCYVQRQDEKTSDRATLSANDRLTLDSLWCNSSTVVYS